MPELENVEKVKVAGFVDPRPRKNKNAERIKKDEEELQEHLKAKDDLFGNVFCKIIHPTVYMAGKIKNFLDGKTKAT